jgi:hypothetical protein
MSLEAQALAALGRPADVGRVVDARRAAAPTGATPGDVMLVAAAELRVHGQREASRAIAERAAGWYRDRPQAEPRSEASLAGLVWALRLAERWTEAQAACRDLVGVAPDEVEYRGTLGALAARVGDRAEAMRILDELRSMDRPELFGNGSYARARIAALLGERPRAVELLRQSFAEGVRHGTRPHREMDFEPLRDDPGFKELLRPKD